MIGVLLMSYGSPNSLDEVEPYYTHIRGGSRPSIDEVENLRQRYQAIGGRSPLLKIVESEAGELEEALQSRDMTAKVYVGMKHWHPFIADVIARIANENVTKLVCIPLAPHYSRTSIGGYRTAVETSVREFGTRIRVEFIESWHLQPGILATWKQLIDEGISRFSKSTSVYVLFTAHSLPERILQKGDPYAQQLAESSSKLAEMLSLSNWGFAFQSAGHTSEKWLGPDILEKLQELAEEDSRDVLIAPIGFTSDHLEILYDIDIEARNFARSAGIRLERTQLPNVSPLFIETLASLVGSRLEIKTQTESTF